MRRCVAVDYVMSSAASRDADAELLPLLTLGEAQDVIEVLAAVLDGGEVDEQVAYCLLSNLAARVPSRD